jgi:flagellar motility protein MotE (MotC chaperone)
VKRLTRSVLQPLVVLALLLAGFAGLRIGVLGPVFATTGAQATGSEADTASQSCASLPELELLFRTLQSERADLDTRLVATQTREAELAEADALIRESYQELERMRAELAAERTDLDRSRQTVSEGAKDDLDRLVSVYEAMKPKEAAGLFQTMSPEFAAGFLGRMQPQSAAEILSGVSPDFAYAVSVLIAGRNARGAE